MSHLRNRHFKTTVKFNHEAKASVFRTRNSSPQADRFNHASQRIKTEPDYHIKSLYNQNISLFRPCFNQNDTSQLPFMATLRGYSANKNDPKPTVSEPFEAAGKTTCNQTNRKRISDFKTRANRLTYAAYRWHNKTGRGSLWATDFECSLRKYEESQEKESKYYSFVAPIHYRDSEERVYDKSEMVCEHYRKSFKVKEETK